MIKDYKEFKAEEFLLEEFKAILEFDAKDVKRIEDFFSKSKMPISKEVTEKMVKLAITMANRITNADKAFNRGEAARSVMGTTGTDTNLIADIFYTRANELGYEGTIPTVIPKVATSTTPPPISTPKKATSPRKPRVKKPSVKKPVVISHEPTQIIGSLLSPEKQFSTYRRPKMVSGVDGSGIKLISLGEVNIADGTSDLYENLYEEWDKGVAEIWKLVNDTFVIIFKNNGVDPSVSIETEIPFLDSKNSKYLFYGELVDYVEIESMSGLIELYGNQIPGFEYK